MVCVVCVSFGATSCSSASTADHTVSTADAYSAAIRWYLDSVDTPTPADTVGTAPTGPVVVYVAPASGKAINSQAQASVVREMSDMTDVVTVRFADARDDALQIDVEAMPVKDDGVLLLVGEVPNSTAPVAVKVAVYHDATDTHTFVMTVTESGDSFVATSVSEVVQG